MHRLSRQSATGVLFLLVGTIAYAGHTLDDGPRLLGQIVDGGAAHVVIDSDGTVLARDSLASPPAGPPEGDSQRYRVGVGIERDYLVGFSAQSITIDGREVTIKHPSPPFSRWWAYAVVRCTRTHIAVLVPDAADSPLEGTLHFISLETFEETSVLEGMQAAPAWRGASPLAPIGRDGLFGLYAPSADEFVLPMEHDAIADSGEGFFAVRPAGEQGFAFYNIHDGTLSERRFIQTTPFSGGIALVHAMAPRFLEGPVEIIDTSMTSLDAVEQPLRSLGFGFQEGLASVCVEGGFFGFIDRSGSFVVPPVFKHAGVHNGGLVQVVMPDDEDDFERARLIVDPAYLYDDDALRGPLIVNSDGTVNDVVAALNEHPYVFLWRDRVLLRESEHSRHELRDRSGRTLWAEDARSNNGSP